jgi:hypothetical protein
MKFEIRNRWTGKVQIEADIACDPASTPFSVQLGLAVKWAIAHGSDLRNSDLRNSDLRNSDLRNSDLSGSFNSELALAQTIIVPEGTIIGWKKCQHNVIVKLLIPKDARRSNATTRKCRAEYAEVLDVYNGQIGISQYDERTQYKVDTTVRCDAWCKDRLQECAGGIHFFLTRIEAENY